MPLDITIGNRIASVLLTHTAEIRAELAELVLANAIDNVTVVNAVTAIETVARKYGLGPSLNVTKTVTRSRRAVSHVRLDVP
jgi:hypothetical protein